MPPKKGAANKNSVKNQISTVPGSEFIEFGDSGKKDKKKKAKDPPPEEPAGPPKPTARQVIGGASWTGKLPVNLLSEHCQRQKWNKPDYSMRQMPAKGGEETSYRSDVTLSRTDPRTRELTKLPPLRLPPEATELSNRSSALEARHFAATYALFRVCSMKNIHMTLPPDYRDLWKGEFARLKKEDVNEGRSWKYDEDPFAAEAKRQEILLDIEKREQEQQKAAKAKDNHVSLVLPLRGASRDKSWERAPKVDMGQQIRLEIELLVKKNAVWNPYGLDMSAQRKHIVLEITKLGFRKSHVEEAVEFCKDQEEVLEWLLIHVPEDDLPKWALPSTYSAGVTLASGDLAKEAKLKRLARAGYSSDDCAEALKNSGGDERRAAQSLQSGLAPEIAHSASPEDGHNIWAEEMQILEAISSENFSLIDELECTISSTTTAGTVFSVRFTCPFSGYPHSAVPIISIQSPSIPAYIRLSATRQVILHAYEHLLGEVMVYNVCQWLETALPGIMDNPGKLSKLQANRTSLASTSNRIRQNTYGPTNTFRGGAKSRNIAPDHCASEDLLSSWKERQATQAQIEMNKSRQALPAWQKREEIIEAVTSHQVTIVSGETGSGKSTQVVQFILDHAIQQSRASSYNILCTQPRRVATISLADRVSNERCMDVGKEVGYIIRGESKISRTTKITFMTTGVLLRRLQSSNSLAEALEDITHVFIDEVHERSLDTDFLLALLKDRMRIQPQLKIILMSATIDAEIFIRYFGGLTKVALVHIEGRTYPVTDHYLDDVLSVTRYNSVGTNENMAKAIQAVGMGINYDLIRDTVECINMELGSAPGAILIFLPGTLEIDRCLKAVENIPNVIGFPLHASLLPTEQRKVFPPAPQGRRKVIAATNVAETSITINDIVAVIDTGKVKETSYDLVNNIVRLEEVWASQAACKQRRGRAGRVQAGTCYKLFTKNTESKMSAKHLPEIQRVPLEQLCLSVKATGADRDIASFLSGTLTPPESGAVSNAVRNLHTMGAMEDNRLTALGMYLSLIPADLRCAKMLVYGTLFGCLESCLTIASILTVRSPFRSSNDRREEANEARASFDVGHGDLLLDLAAYEQWDELNHHLRSREVQNWCSSKFISQQTMRDISSTRRQVLDSLKDAGLVPLSYRSSPRLSGGDISMSETLLLRALIAASLQPQIAAISFPSKKYIASMSGAKELDPEARTIKYFAPDQSNTNLPSQATFDHVSSQIPRGRETDVVRNNNDENGHAMSRIFIHPSSILFTSQSFSHHATHLSYFTKMQTSKPFMRDLTPLNLYSLLLFGGKLELDTTGAGLLVGGVWKVSGWARIGVLINRLRALLDEELRSCVERGGILLGQLEGGQVVRIVKRLIELNGQDQ